MPSGTPATIAPGLLARLNELRRQTAASDVELKRLERQAQRLLKADALTAYMALGAVATLQGDVDGMHANHKRAVDLAPNSALPYQNYGSSLMALARFDEARSIAMKGLQADPDDQDILTLAIHMTLMCGLFSEAQELLNLWASRHPGRQSEFPDATVRALDRIRSRGASEEDHVRSILRLVEEVLQGANFRVAGPALYADDVDEDGIVIECYTMSSTDEAGVLNDSFDKAFSNRADLIRDTGLLTAVMFWAVTDDGSNA